MPVSQKPKRKGKTIQVIKTEEFGKVVEKQIIHFRHTRIPHYLQNKKEEDLESEKQAAR